ncbi:TetR family transcriptional regulator [Streptomyces sp. NPDC056670]|uniref:TetR family transcriptional regulator n=1 Tax=Streptomyces sp. NPDC056670 TaxID=3345904 RepID=UPI0036808A52
MTTRVRRTPEEARRQILEAAAKLLTAGGPAAVQVRAVAAEVGVSDAAVNHHFGTHEQLLSALLRFGGARLKSELRAALDEWGGDGAADPARLVHVLAGLYADGYAELALALRQLGWRDTGSGMLDEAVDRLHTRAVTDGAATGRTPPPREAVQLTVAALHQAVATEPLFGDEFRRSVGLDASARDRLVGWWIETLRTTLAGRDASTRAMHKGVGDR